VRAGNMTQCIGVIIAYWIIYLLCEGVARNGQAPAWFAIWVPNFLFGIFGVQSLRKNWN
jgi:lipopolysaccharide export LptBFGC system permease protein LptF